MRGRGGKRESRESKESKEKTPLKKGSLDPKTTEIQTEMLEEVEDSEMRDNPTVVDRSVDSVAKTTEVTIGNQRIQPEIGIESQKIQSEIVEKIDEEESAKLSKLFDDQTQHLNLSPEENQKQKEAFVKFGLEEKISLKAAKQRKEWEIERLSLDYSVEKLQQALDSKGRVLNEKEKESATREFLDNRPTWFAMWQTEKEVHLSDTKKAQQTEELLQRRFEKDASPHQQRNLTSKSQTGGEVLDTTQVRSEQKPQGEKEKDESSHPTTPVKTTTQRIVITNQIRKDWTEDSTPEFSPPQKEGETLLAHNGKKVSFFSNTSWSERSDGSKDIAWPLTKGLSSFFDKPNEGRRPLDVDERYCSWWVVDKAVLRYGSDVRQQIVSLPNGTTYFAEVHFEPTDRTKYFHGEFLRELMSECDQTEFQAHATIDVDGMKMIHQPAFDYDLFSEGVYPFEGHPLRLFDPLLSPDGEGEGFFSKRTGFSGVDYDDENGVLIFPNPTDGGETKFILHTRNLFKEIQKNEKGEPRLHPLQRQQEKFKGDMVELSRFVICFLDRIPYFPTPGNMSQRYNQEVEKIKEEFERQDERKEEEERRAYLI